MIETWTVLREGARWYRCALQVNPFAYLVIHKKLDTAYPDEESYNAALIAALKASKVDVIAITDHWRVDSGEKLRQQATSAGIVVFPGFEATSKEGVHLLVLFNPDVTAEQINRCIGECGIRANCQDSAPGLLNIDDLLIRAERWNAVIIAPHVTTDAGLLGQLKGQARIVAWTNPRLRAAGHSGGTPSQAHADILKGKNSEYARSTPMALINAADINGPSDVEKSGSTTWIKMSSLTARGLDLAFRTPATRVERGSLAAPDHPVIIGIEWAGGFLDGVRLRLNESLNTLIGGRGSGKSTVIESIRYALDVEPLTAKAVEEHRSMVNDVNVLGSGTQVKLLIRCPKPASSEYVVERSVPGRPIVRTIDGKELQSTPFDLVGNIEVYGQRELADLARDKKQLTSMIARYMPQASAHSERLYELKSRLEKSRNKILDLQRELKSIEEKLGRLPVLQERLQNFDKAGIAERLSSQRKIQQEEAILGRALSSIENVARSSKDWPETLAVDTAYLEIEGDVELPNAALLEKAKSILVDLNTSMSSSITDILSSLGRAREELESVKEEWSQASSSIRSALNQALRALQPDGIDGNEYLRLTHEVNSLEALRPHHQELITCLESLKSERLQLLVQVEELRKDRLRDLKSAAKKVGRRLVGAVRVEIVEGKDRSPLINLVDTRLSGRKEKIRSAIESAAILSVRDLADTCRQGVEEVMNAYAVTPMQADLLANAGEEFFMLIEETDLPVTTELELNLGTKQAENWRALDRLSTGQKATALLLILLQEGSAPLIIDQPEDDLDNRFIYDEIVPKIRSCKIKRQLIFATHNANIPVLGDADQIVTLMAWDVGGRITGSIDPEGCGSIDDQGVREIVEELLEGGREAFDNRRYLYGF
ncbi:TrlF family AAA-like ATPase [Nonomuraea sp. bgisy101]|uniref:TrlF family AAA-like ATPase n=1 Tax=Nonomuraea sp. bgisy101 TaxID=3413784 RepID=UPI003D718B6C